MGIKTFFLCFSLVHLVGCSSIESNRVLDSKDPINLSINKNAKAFLLEDKVSSLSIGIYKDGKSYTGHYGELKKGKGNAPTDKTLYEIASVGKTFIGLLVSQAVLDGKLSLEDDVRNYLTINYPNFEYQGHPVKIRHLITHTSGLPPFFPTSVNALFDDFNESLPFKMNKLMENYSKQDFLNDLHSIVLKDIPGTQYAYSNVDTELMAHLLENIYQRPYQQILEQYLANVTDMPDTKISLTPEQQSRLANGYGMTGKPAPDIANSLWGADGLLKSSMSDLVNYMHLQLNQNNQSVHQSHQVIYDGEDEKRSYYWPVENSELDGTYFRHHGGAFGTQNWLLIIPKHNLGISVITNQSGHKTAGKLMKVVRGLLQDLR